MKCSYFTGTGEKLFPDGYEGSDIKLTSKKINGLRTHAIKVIRLQNYLLLSL
jgi:hypothetical protein